MDQSSHFYNKFPQKQTNLDVLYVIAVLMVSCFLLRCNSAAVQLTIFRPYFEVNVHQLTAVDCSYCCSCVKTTFVREFESWRATIVVSVSTAAQLWLTVRLTSVELRPTVRRWLAVLLPVLWSWSGLTSTRLDHSSHQVLLSTITLLVSSGMTRLSKNSGIQWKRETSWFHFNINMYIFFKRQQKQMSV